MDSGEHTPKGPKKPSSCRIQMTMKPEEFDQIEELRKRRGNSTISNLIRSGLTLLEEYQLANEEGQGMYVKEPDGTFVKLRIP